MSMNFCGSHFVPMNAGNPLDQENELQEGHSFANKTPESCVDVPYITNLDFDITTCFKKNASKTNFHPSIQELYRTNSYRFPFVTPDVNSGKRHGTQLFFPEELAFKLVFHQSIWNWLLNHILSPYSWL